jgi:ribosomal protein S12 methylthiotransferase accessory factor
LLPALANEGISNIKCVDTAQVSEQDLYISPIYKNDDVNKFRETAIIERVKDDFPRTKFQRSGIDRLDEDGVNRILNDSDIVVSCVDKGFTAINYWVNKAALKRSLSWYSSRLDGTEASVGPLFIPGKTPCYMCYTMRLVSNELVYRDSVTYLKYLDANKKDEWAKRCLLSVNPAILANYLASEVIKNLIGIGSPLAGKVLLLNLLNLKTEIHNILRVPNCPHCGNSRR